MKTELVLLANAYIEVATWTDSKGDHSAILRTVAYDKVAGADRADMDVILNKYEKVQPVAQSKGR